MLAADAFSELQRSLKASLFSLEHELQKLGFPELVEIESLKTEQLFQGYSKSQPNSADSYAAALAFYKGKELDDWQREIVAPALCIPLREERGAVALRSERFVSLLDSYENEARRGELWRLTWHGLLTSYFGLDTSQLAEQDTQKSWRLLQQFLERTWPFIDEASGEKSVPNWMLGLRQDTKILGESPAKKYAQAYLDGDTSSTDAISSKLGISSSSWFWHALVLAAVERAASLSDADFTSLIPRLIGLVNERPAFRDDAIERILVRYHANSNAPAHERLRDFVIQPTVWKNPKLKSAGIATAWNRVPEPVWRMVLSWVNEQNLKDFFDILAARNKADEGRLAFWSQYLKQISWTRLVFGAQTMLLKNQNAAVRELIAREDGAYAQLTKNAGVDAFMMKLGNYVVVEFSKAPNACFIYKAQEMPFDPYGKFFVGENEDLKHGNIGECAARIPHTPRWQLRASDELRALGIQKDSRRYQSESISTQRVSTDESSSDERLRSLLRRFPGASQYRLKSGRLWVKDPQQRAALSKELEALGFRWAQARNEWYYPEN